MAALCITLAPRVLRWEWRHIDKAVVGRRHRLVVLARCHVQVRLGDLLQVRPQRRIVLARRRSLAVVRVFCLWNRQVLDLYKSDRLNFITNCDLETH